MKKKQMKLVYNTVVVLLLLVSIVWIFSKFIHLGNVEYTDNAQVKQQIVPINTRVQGFIKEIYFTDYQDVKKGDTLLIIEDIEFRHRVAQAEADYKNALIAKEVLSKTIRTTESNIGVTEAGISEAKVRMENAEREYLRYKNLLAEKSVTRQQFDAMKTNYEAAKARYEQMSRQKETTTLVKDEQTLRLEQAEAGIKLAEVALELARLNFSYTIITAPCDGVTGRKNIEIGQLVQPGQAVVNLVNESEKWVVANYKETQTENLAVGQEVEITVDAISSVIFKGRIESISGATGASFSIFPQDNSAGNFVKVEQRIPVRIEFTSENSAEDMALLRAGMNVECEVNY